MASRKKPEPATAGQGALAFASHDHADCRGDVLARVATLSPGAGIRLTPVRRRTLEILLESHRAMGAYEVLDRLAAEGFGSQPPVAYRALDYLVEHGLAHRIRRLNAFAACMNPGDDHSPVFFICKGCNGLAEAPARPVRAAVEAAAGAIGFSVERMTVETLGLCPGCQGRGA